MEIARTGHRADSRAVARDTRGWKPRAQDTNIRRESGSAPHRASSIGDLARTKLLKQETTRSANRAIGCRAAT